MADLRASHIGPPPPEEPRAVELCAEVKDNFQAVRLGINHKFGGPVVVKYGSAFSSAVQEPRIVRGQAFLCLEDQS